MPYAVEGGGLYHRDATRDGVWIPRAAAHQAPKDKSVLGTDKLSFQRDLPLTVALLAVTGLKLISSWLYKKK